MIRFLPACTDINEHKSVFWNPSSSSYDSFFILSNDKWSSFVYMDTLLPFTVLSSSQKLSSEPNRETWSQGQERIRKKAWRTLGRPKESTCKAKIMELYHDKRVVGRQTPLLTQFYMSNWAVELAISLPTASIRGNPRHKPLEAPGEAWAQVKLPSMQTAKFISFRWGFIIMSGSSGGMSGISVGAALSLSRCI